MHYFSIYGSHDASICIKPSHDFYRIYELERLTKKRNYSLNADPQFKEHLITIKKLIKEEYGIEEYGTCVYGQVEPHILSALKEIFGFNHFEEISHHLGHAMCAYYQSPFDNALIVSSDGGGHEMQDGICTFCMYYMQKNERIRKIGNIPLDVCSPFTLMAVPIKEIYKDDIYTKYLTYAGKIMGLSAYGKVNESWLSAMRTFYHQNAFMENLTEMGNKIGLDLSNINTISENDSYDLAATSQFLFEEISKNTIASVLLKYNCPIILTGGGALNVLLNQNLKESLKREVFVPVNPNDSGLSFGFMALRNPPEKKVNIAYNGMGILDINEIEDYVKKYRAKKTSTKELARLICKGKIIGILKGNSEVGPRALGNRSIVCDPSFKEMKDKLNKIKKREFFRPFAPVCKEEDASKYFNVPPGDKMPFMSYAPKVREEYKDIIPSIVHKDGTARVQTVNENQNKFLYDLIDCVETISGTGIILNTSFNIRGLPILTTIKDAIEVLETTELDYIVIEDYLFEKNKKRLF